MAAEPLTLKGHAESVAEVAAGYCAVAPLRTEIQVHGDLAFEPVGARNSAHFL